jgi:hypothetical protein
MASSRSGFGVYVAGAPIVTDHLATSNVTAAKLPK